MNLSCTKPTTVKDLQARLSSMHPDFSKGTRRTADFVMANPRAVVILSAAEAAKRCDDRASGPVRLAQDPGLSGFRELQSVLQSDPAATMEASGQGAEPRRPLSAPGEKLKRRHLAESGKSVNQAASNAAERDWSENPDVNFRTELHLLHSVDAEGMAHRISTVAVDSDGILLVARDHPAVNRAVRDAKARSTPVFCLTSNLPASGRTAFVGSDRYASGSMAG